MTDKIHQAMLAHSPIHLDSGNTPCLNDFLAYAQTHAGADVQGLTFATNGTWPVLGFDKCSSTKTPKLSVTPIDGRHFEPTKVFELRLWIPVKLPDEPAEGNLLACEYRWANGVGAVELRVTAGTDSSQTNGSKGSFDRGWVHAVQYLEHIPYSRSTAKHVPASSDRKSDQSSGGTTTSYMTTLEFIQAEDKYGNTVIIDQLFTGKWN